MFVPFSASDNALHQLLQLGCFLSQSLWSAEQLTIGTDTFEPQVQPQLVGESYTPVHFGGGFRDECPYLG